MASGKKPKAVHPIGVTGECYQNNAVALDETHSRKCNRLPKSEECYTLLTLATTSTTLCPMSQEREQCPDSGFLDSFSSIHGT